MKSTTIFYAALALSLALAAAPARAAAVNFIPGEPDPDDEPEVLSEMDEKPEFPGGMAYMFQYVARNLQYPAIARENGIQGRVIVSFVVNQDGSVEDVMVVRGVDPVLDKEARRVISAMPKWKPGRQRGKPIRARCEVPVLFRLE